MRDFPQELVDQVIDELFVLVGRSNSYPDSFKRFRGPSGYVHGISHYSLVSRAWAGPAQKHHFSILHLDCPTILEKWVACVPPDPNGVSRHVRKLVLDGFDPLDLEDFGEHLHAFTRVECLTVDNCLGTLHHPFILEWFLAMGSSLVELRISDSPVTSQTITSLLSALPLLKSLEVFNFENPDDEDDENLSAPSSILFFEGGNRFALRSDPGHRYPEGSLDWIPPSARFRQLEVDMTCSLNHPDLVNQWFVASCTMLTSLTIREDREVRFPKVLRPLNLSPCTALQSLRIPISTFVETFLPYVTATPAKVIFDLHGRFDWRAIKLGDRAVDVVEEHLCPLAKRFHEAHPGRQMEVGIAGYIGKRPDRIRVLRVLNDRMFMPTLKKEAKFVIPPI